MIENQFKENEGLMEFDLDISAELTNLPAIREFIQNIASQACNYDQFSHDLVLAVDELATNIILHGYQGREGTIAIHVEVNSSKIQIVLTDDADAFDPTMAEDPDIHRPLEERKIGGLGIFMAKILTDEMIYRPLPEGGNELRIVKHCPKFVLDSMG
jgi:serine/threonine-protein kinase RsbW